MAYIRWDESLSVGVAEIDEQHRRLFALVDALHELCAAACSPGALMAAVEEFCDYTRHHFATEERYMDAYEYRGMDAHIQEHMRCSLRAVDFLGQCLEGDPALCDEFLAFLKDWLVNHIQKVDKRYSQAFARAGIS